MPAVVKLYNLRLNAVIYSAYFIGLWARQLSGDVPEDAGFLCVRSAGSWDTTKGTPVTDVPVELIMEVTRRTDVTTVIKGLWHLTGSSEGIATGKLLNCRVGFAYYSRHHPVRTCSGAQPTFYSVSTVGSLRRVKRPVVNFASHYV